MMGSLFCPLHCNQFVVACATQNNIFVIVKMVNNGIQKSHVSVPAIRKLLHGVCDTASKPEKSNMQVDI